MTEPTPLWQTTEHADLAVLEHAWGAHRLSLILGAALGSYNRLGNVNALAASTALDVSEGTIRRWVRNGVPTSRQQAVIELVRPPQGAFEDEYSELITARRNLEYLEQNPSGAAEIWGIKRWDEPHDLAVVKLAGEPFSVARIARTEREPASTRRMLQGGQKDTRGHYLPPAEIATFPNYFAAAIARLEILEDVYAYRVRMPHGRLDRGGSKAWLTEAPRKPLKSYRKKGRIRPRTGATVGIRHN
ncbi:hypothetical protein DC31_06410 [Microbacterium sp. CH12i]|uniref:hypothetical protein n=1 Tax=Microbacterium sp. CH12i TaxID=1479651 RepID=UPI000460FD71|nr:hypothetical protein [Microbacterium sp. CH12i]KDA04531.1 hypothetical protein DC31_06410 [Microbacterium sp. CH12i]